MNPLLVARSLREEYLRLLKTAFHPRQDDVREAFNAEVERDGFLTREPFIALAQPYKFGSALTELLPLTQQRFGPICQSPYHHQAEACRRILSGQATVVATGTGSGKTESFLMPIVDHCVRVHEPGKNSVKAILIYPMNALANDQCARIRRVLEGTDISFGRYTRETKMWGSRPSDAPANERVLRQEFRQSPPDLLLTNYMMLEYMLMRGDGRDIFANHQVRFIVLDEVHTYHGMLGTDVACLLRRLGEALRKSNPNGPPPLYIGTSATLQAGEEGDPKVGIAKFFTQLTGQVTPAEAVVTEVSDPPSMPPGVTLPPPPNISEADLGEFDADAPGKIEALIEKLAGLPASGTQRESVSEIWSGMALPYLLMEWLRQPRSEEAIVDELAARPERAGVQRAALRREIEAALLVGPCLPDDNRVKLRPRVHRFLRGLARFYRCVNPDCGKLLGEGIDTCDLCGCGALPLALCRTCGWDFFMATAGDEGHVEPWIFRRSDETTFFLFDPPGSEVEVDAEEDPSGEEVEDAEVPLLALPDVAGTGEPPQDYEVDVPDEEPPDVYLNPKTLRMGTSPGDLGPDSEFQPRPLRMHVGRGNRCPVCRSRYGPFDILTPVSLGNSSALAHVSRVLMRDLPQNQRKLLVFCDSRQDAAHQARFIRAIEDHLRLRRLAYQSLAAEGEPHDFDWLVETLYEQYIEDGTFKRSKKKDQQTRDKKTLEGLLLTEFAVAARVRAGLERLGLVKVCYAGLDDDLADDEFQQLCAQHHLVPELAAQSVVVLLNEMRQRMALNNEALKTRLYANDKLARLYRIQVNRQVGIPVAFRKPGEKTDEHRGYKLLPTWNAKGSPAGIQSIWRQFHKESATQESLESVLHWLDEHKHLAWEEIGSKDERGEGWQIRLDALEFEAGRSFLRCRVCDRIAANGPAGGPCPRPTCRGTMRPWIGPLAEENINALMAQTEYAPPLYAEEHSAAVTDEKRQAAEEGFSTGKPPRPNLLACTPTLEMGINIGDLEAVAMRNIPPSPANYAQRSGRTGRTSRMGITAGFSRNTPHDGYFFDHPDEIIAGAIPPPKFNLRNLEAIARHVRSLILEYAQLDIPNNLEKFLQEKGQLIEPKVKEVVDKVAQAGPCAIGTARTLWSDIPGVTDAFLQKLAEEFPSRIRAVLVERGSLLAQAAEEVHKLGDKIKLTPKEEDAQRGYRELAIRLREDNRYAYLPRVLAEAGLLPGYSFPSDPGSVALGYDPEPVFGGRIQAQREFAPGQIVYARGGRWKVGGVALHRPGATSTAGPHQFKFTLCGHCGTANNPNLDFCARCQHPIGDNAGHGLPDFTAWDAGAFQAWDAEVAADTEEERAIVTYDVRPHPQLDVGGRRYRVGPWALDLREQEEIWYINHGLKDVRRLEEEKAQSPGFHLCPTCGGQFSRPQAKKVAKGKQAQGDSDARADVTAHAKRCSGQPQDFSLGHKVKADTLRLVVPGIASRGDEGIAWAWSFVYAIIQGAVRLFEIDEDNVEVFVLIKTSTDAEGQKQREVLDIVWIDRVVGGSGILQRLVSSFPKVAEAALKHLDGHDCPNSCYRCLRSYRNQSVHKSLDWRQTVAYLRALTAEAVVYEGPFETATPAPPTEGPEWEEARAEGCESPQELRLLKAIRAVGTLPEPEKQFVVYDNGRILTRADFAYLDCQPHLLLYVDGLEWHSAPRQRVHDNRITNRLQTLGYRVFRFLGTETHSHPERCVAQVIEARDMQTPGSPPEAPTWRTGIESFVDQQFGGERWARISHRLIAAAEAAPGGELTFPDFVALAAASGLDWQDVHVVAEKMCHHQSGVWRRVFVQDTGGTETEIPFQAIAKRLREHLDHDGQSEWPDWTRKIRVKWRLASPAEMEERTS